MKGKSVNRSNTGIAEGLVMGKPAFFSDNSIFSLAVRRKEIHLAFLGLVR